MSYSEGRTLAVVQKTLFKRPDDKPQQTEFAQLLSEAVRTQRRTTESPTSASASACDSASAVVSFDFLFFVRFCFFAGGGSTSCVGGQV